VILEAGAPPRGYLGVDMGGSGTRAYLLQAATDPLAWEAPGGNLALAPEQALDVLVPLVRRAAPEVACLGLAGARTSPEVVDRLVAELAAQLRSVIVMTDAELALAAAFSPLSDGIVLCAGTGSVAVVRKDGVVHHLGGHGFLFGDAGSAFDIGRRLVAATLRDRDRGGKSLVDQVEPLLGVPLDDFVRDRYLEPADRFQLARLAEDVATLSHPIAHEIVGEAAAGLVKLVASARDRFGQLPVRLVGGVFRIPAVAEKLRVECGATLADTRPEVAAAQLAAAAST
jgi:N-acetylglucosamine kinase-like BadF-type ATPase